MMIRIENNFDDTPVDVSGNEIQKREKTEKNPRGAGRIGRRNPNFVSRKKETRYISATEIEWMVISKYVEDVKNGTIDLTPIVDEIQQKAEEERQRKVNEIEKENLEDGVKLRKAGRPTNEERGVESNVRKQHFVRAHENEWQQIKEFMALQRESFDSAEAVIELVRRLVAPRVNEY